MVHPDTYIKATSKGLGLFAKRRFERGSILWITDDIDVKIPLADYLALDSFRQQKLNVYSYLDYQNRVIVPWDEGKYINHSCTHNSTGLLDFDNISISLRTIESDEEIVEDYASYFGHFESFTCACKAPNCRGFITGDESYRSDLRLLLADIQPLLLNQSQHLLQIRSAEIDQFFRILHRTVPVL